MDNQKGPTLCYSTGNPAQCYMAAWMGGKFGGGYMYIYMAESLCCPPETITALLIGYTSKQNEVLKQECMIHEGRDLAITSPAHNALFYI